MNEPASFRIRLEIVLDEMGLVDVCVCNVCLLSAIQLSHVLLIYWLDRDAVSRLSVIYHLS